jgi:WD40 repeat protein
VEGKKFIKKLIRLYLSSGSGTSPITVYPTGKVQSADPLTVYNKYKGAGEEYMVSGSDDFTLFLWHPAKSNKPVCRMTGHQQLINQVTYLFS